MHSDSYETLLHKHLSGELSETEKFAFEKWLEASPENRRRLDEAERIWTLTASAGSQLDIDLDLEKAQFKRRIAGESSPAKIFTLATHHVWRYAAVAVLLIGAMALLWRFGTEGETDFLVVETRAGETQEVTLPDQSVVWLNELSRLAYPPEFGKRTVELTGEAFFDVERDESKTFEIRSGEGLVQVLGTSFNVRNRNGEGEIRVTVATGRVGFKVVGTDEAQELTAGYQGVLHKTDRSMSSFPNDNPEFLMWRSRPLAFDATSFDDVVALLRGRFAIVIDEPDADLKACTFTGEFETPVLAEVLESIEFSLGLDVSVNQGVYAFSGIGCSSSESD